MANAITHNIAVTFAVLTIAFATTNAQAGEPMQTLWFTDSRVNAFYAVDETDHRVIVTTEPGPRREGHATRTEKQLADGEHFVTSLDGHGRNALTVTLAVTRSGNDMNVQITTTPRERSVNGWN